MIKNREAPLECNRVVTYQEDSPVDECCNYRPAERLRFRAYSSHYTRIEEAVRGQKSTLVGGSSCEYTVLLNATERLTSIDEVTQCIIPAIAAVVYSI